MRTPIAAFLFCAFVIGSSRAAEPELAQQAQAILKAHCYRCHGAEGKAEGGFNYILDREQLVARKKLIPGNVKKSRLLERVADGEMPPEGEKPRLTDEEVALLRKWVAAGAPDFGPARKLRPFHSTGALLEAICDDLDTLPERDRPFARYFTLTHLVNAGLQDDQLQTYRHALSKLVNSLSWSRRVVVPAAVGPDRTMVRIDLRDYKWTAKTWDIILGRNPYGVSYDTEAARYIAAATRNDQAYIRGDWFVAVAATPPLYHQLMQLPDSERELETLLRIEVDEDVRSERVVRAGFNGSGIARNNRVIERHDAAYGAYWRSYDFAGNTEIQNIFTNPLGPGDGEAAFRHDGGEIIFNLPNGLQAYLLVDGKGNRIDRAPVGVVSDPKRPDRTVENGLSCMSCHSRGLIDKADQVRDHVLKNPKAFGKNEADTILALYPPREKFQALLKEDIARFRDALSKTGAPASETEPIAALAQRFEAELDLPLAAAEAGLTTAEFQRRVQASPTLGRTLGPLLVAGGTVQRQTFVDGYADMIAELRLGTTYRVDANKPAPAAGLVVRVDLVDGTRLRGRLVDESIPMQTAGGKLDIQANKILVLRLDKTGDLLATAREVISGTVTAAAFKVVTDRGPVEVKRGRARVIAAADRAPAVGAK